MCVCNVANAHQKLSVTLNPAYMFARSLIRLLLYIACLVGVLSGCKIADLPQLPTTLPVPTTFTGSADTLSMGDLIWEDFFNDRYLLKLIDTALSNNLDVLTAAQRIRMAQANFQMSKGALQPSLNGRVATNVGKGVGNNLIDNPTQGTPGSNLLQNYFIGVQSTWEADLWGKLRLRREADYARFLASEKGRHLVITNLVAEVAQRYYELLGLDNELETIQKNVEFQEVALEMVRIQKIGGRATELAVQQFHAQLLRTQSLSYEKQQRIIEVENQLNQLLGRYPQPIARGTSILKQHLPDVVRAGVPSSMLLRRPDIQQAELELVAARADVEAARAAFLPSLVISPYAGVNVADLSVLMKPEALALGALAGLTAPIFSKNRIKANYDRASAETMAAFYTYQQRILMGHQEVVSDLKRIENYRKVYELRQQEAEVLTAAVSTSNDLFAAGYATYLEVITAQARVLEAELSVTNTRKEIFVSVIDLYRALGGGWR